MPHYRSNVQRFWAKVHKTSSCWIWTASLSSDGHGHFWTDGHFIRAHRFAWILENGPLLPGMIVCHQCGNSSCVRVSHLAIGSIYDNAHDPKRRCYGSGQDIIQEIRTKYGHRPNLEERFWSKVDKISSPHGCWLWTASRDKRGYGKFSVKSQDPMVLAHRFAWALFNGEILSNLCVCHNCPGGDNPTCVNPLHMFLGTQEDNRGDAMKKHVIRNGIHHHANKLTEEDIDEIRRLRGKVSQQILATRFHVMASHISNIQQLKAWKHIPSTGEVLQIGRHEPYAKNTKLTSEIVRNIRDASCNGILPMELAKKYGVALCTISNIIARRSWKNA